MCTSSYLPEAYGERVVCETSVPNRPVDVLRRRFYSEMPCRHLIRAFFSFVSSLTCIIAVRTGVIFTHAGNFENALACAFLSLLARQINDSGVQVL